MASPDETPSRSGPIAWMARHTVAANMVMVIFILGGLLVSFNVKQEVFPEFKRETILCTVAYPGASPEEVEQGILLSIEDVVRGLDGVKGVESGSSSGGSHLVGAIVWIKPPDQRDFSALEFANAWRAAIGTISGLESLTFKAKTGPTGGDPIDIQLSHRSRAILEPAARELAGVLSQYAGVTDIDDGVSLGKSQLSFRIKPEARSVGLNATDLARQVRGAF